MLMHNAEKAFDDRKLDIEVADRMNCRFVDGKFVFEYKDMDATVSRKMRSLEKKFWFEPSMPALLWNIDALRGLGSKPADPLIICEGEFDAIAVAQTGFGIAVSVPNGSNGRRSEGEIDPTQDLAFRYLWGSDGRLLPEIDQFDKIILATDGDEKGMILRDELAVRIGDSRCWFVNYPDQCKDANDVLRIFDLETLTHILRGAKPIRPGHLVRPCDLPPRRMQTSYSSGWGYLDKHLMIVRPELMVVTGQPGHGKSMWVRSLTFHLAESHKWRIGYLTPEDPAHRLHRDMERFAIRAGKRERNADWINDRFFISQPPEDDAISLELVEAEMAAAALHHDCQVFVVDPWNEISHDRGRRTDTEYVEQALVRLKRKARRYNMLLIIVAHPRKIEADKKANLYDISGSSNWRNKADHGIIIHRPFPDANDVEIIIEKCKDHETMGTPGKTWIRYIKGECEFEPGP